MQQSDELLRIVRSAICAFNIKERYLIESDLSERCVCARSAPYLERQLLADGYVDYVVDVEYNRSSDGRSRRRKVLDDHNITVDLIAHKRGRNPEEEQVNLICIEMKKAVGGRGMENDKMRLCKLTDSCYGYNYQAGFMILIRNDKKLRESCLTIESRFVRGIEYKG